MRVWGMTLGENRLIVATKTKRSAAVLFGISLNGLNTYGCPTANAEEIALASAEPGVVFARSLRGTSRGPYVRRG
jgi:hypothetical protein